MASFDVRDPDFEARVRESFGNLTLMRTMGARLLSVAPGEVDIELPFRSDLTQHHGFLAAAALTAIVDVACGYAAMTLMAPGASVLTVEYKVNFLSPAQGERMVARGRVLRPGRTVTACTGDVLAVTGGEERLVATMLGTMATVRGEERDAPRMTPEVTRAYGLHMGSRHSRASLRRARTWCVCRDGKLRHQLQRLLGA